MHWVRKNIITIITILMWILPPGGAIAVLVLGWLQQAPWYLIVVGMIVVICLIPIAINQFEARLHVYTHYNVRFYWQYMNR